MRREDVGVHTLCTTQTSASPTKEENLLLPSLGEVYGDGRLWFGNPQNPSGRDLVWPHSVSR